MTATCREAIKGMTKDMNMRQQGRLHRVFQPLQKEEQLTRNLHVVNRMVREKQLLETRQRTGPEVVGRLVLDVQVQRRQTCVNAKVLRLSAEIVRAESVVTSSEWR